METGLLVLSIICGAGIVASVTYIICLVAHERKKNKDDRYREEYVIDDDTLTIDLSNNGKKR
ncbi:MAG: hypothetical protein NC350_02865 [Corallococcus sp.]|nr:hypothetical protein [Corallococcus sp.]